MLIIKTHFNKRGFLFYNLFLILVIIKFKENVMTYKEVIIIFKNNLNSEDIFDSGSYSVSYKNVGYKIEGDYLILEVDKGGEIEGHILSLKSIINYKIIK